MYVIRLVGCSTESTKMSYITDMIFICQFFNTGFLLMICNSDMTEQGGLLKALFHKGALSDFETNWYTQMGETIVGSMTINMVFPIGFEIGMYFMRNTLRCLDFRGA